MNDKERLGLMENVPASKVGEAAIHNVKTQDHVETFFAQVEQESGTGLPQFVKTEFAAFLECGILAHGFLRLRCGDCAHEKLVAFSCRHC
jgi:hypothetical protein